jgi:hypothetical protein
MSTIDLYLQYKEKHKEDIEFFYSSWKNPKMLRVQIFKFVIPAFLQAEQEKCSNHSRGS